MPERTVSTPQLSIQDNPTVVLDAMLRRLTKSGFASWSGGKPKGSKRPVKLTPGPPISDYIIEDRERARADDA